MRLWRLASPRYARALDDEGARQYGGRWNSAGVPAVYASLNASTAFLETLVQVDPPDLPDAFELIELYVPDDAPRSELDLAAFPPNWREDLAQPWFKSMGDGWLEDGSGLLLIVPSVIVPPDRNALINPRHGDLARIKIERVTEFPVDPRFRRG